MSLFKYGNLEAEIDFTDADFLDRIDEAKQNLKEDMKGIPKTGKAADIVRAQCQCFFNFFDYILGEGTHEEMFQGRTSLNMCIDASDMIAKLEEEEVDKLNKKYDKYTVQQHGNRQQKRNYNKQQGKKHNKGNVSYYPNGNR